MKKRILVVLGTRPEAIKCAPIIHAFQRDVTRFETVVCVTAQHRDMLDQVMACFNITPDIDLDIMKPNQTLTTVTTTVLDELQRVLGEVRPDIVMAQGDTTTVLASALAAFYARVPFAHIEAGLRTHNKQHPYPEEINRQLVSRIADIHFAPTPSSKENLIAEGIPAETIHVTGNSVIDALYYIVEKNRGRELPLPVPLPGSSTLILVTAHRRENFGEGIQRICQAIDTLANRHPDLVFVYPVHPNPNIQQPVYERLSSIPRVFLIPPQEYPDLVNLIDHATVILTDSGGIQEEAPSLGKPVIVLRETTERPEAVESGTVKLVGTNTELIISEVERLLSDSEYYLSMSRAHNPYGDGKTAPRIVKCCAQFLEH